MPDDVIASFVRRYAKEQDYYERVAQLVGNKIQKTLRDRSIRGITTWRAKQAGSLDQKLRQRSQQRVNTGKSPYSSEEEIYNDIPDLAGARVALYFPKDRATVQEIVEKEFNSLRPVKQFPSLNADLEASSKSIHRKKRFSGYTAEHYLVQIRKESLSKEDIRLADGRCEIQIASVLMHAWSEVEHDLEYKDLSGDVSEIESALLDQINGLVIAGEIALEQLQKALTTRLNSSGSKLRDHYDLAVWLSSVAHSNASKPEVGRADLAFRFLEKIGLTNTDSLRPYKGNLEGVVNNHNGEIRLADQLIEILQEEAPDRAHLLAEARRDIVAENYSAIPATASDSSPDAVALTNFLEKWRGLEKLASKYQEPSSVASRGPLGVLSELSRQIHDSNMSTELRSLRQLRNRAIHGIDDAPTIAELFEGARRTDELTKKIEEALSTSESTKGATNPKKKPELKIQKNPAIALNSRKAIIVPLLVDNPAETETTISEIELKISGEFFFPTLPMDGLEVSGLPFRSLENGIRLQANDTVRCALYFKTGPQTPTTLPDKAILRIHSIRDGVIESELAVQ